MTPINLPPFDIKLSGTRQHPRVLDVLRRRYVALTPEEWVRQHFVHFLIEHRGFPASLVANEVELTVGNKRLRADTIIYNKEARPLVVVEYKAPTITLTARVLEQITAYNTLLNAPWLMVSNGMQHLCGRWNANLKQVSWMEEIPDYGLFTE